jgi:hypothetical protein
MFTDINLNNLVEEQNDFQRLILPKFPFATNYQSKVVSVEDISTLINPDGGHEVIGLRIVPLVESDGEIKIYLEAVYTAGGIGPVPGPGVG